MARAHTHPTADPMVVELQLTAGASTRSRERVEVRTALCVNTGDPTWAGLLVDTIAAQAEQGARHLVAQFTPPSPPALDRRFVPLAAVAPTIALPAARAAHDVR
jgi:hypothetical protein